MEGCCPANEVHEPWHCAAVPCWAAETTAGPAIAAATPETIRPILLPFSSVNHRLPSAPLAISSGIPMFVIPVVYSVTAPEVVISPIESFAAANQMLPSDPTASP